MKRAKNILLYTVCIGVVLYLAYCVAAMGYSDLSNTADAYMGAAEGMFHGAHLFRNLLIIGAMAWLILSYLGEISAVICWYCWGLRRWG